MISSYFRRERASSTAFRGISVADFAIHMGTHLLQLLDTELYSASSVVIVTFFRTARALSHRHVGYSAGQRLHRALAVGVGSGRDQQSELARAFGHPISNGLKKVVTSEGLIRDDEDSGHCGLPPGLVATEFTTINRHLSLGFSFPATGQTSRAARNA